MRKNRVKIELFEFQSIGGIAMDEHQKKLNDFLVVTFNEILRWEEAALKRWTDANLSMSEFHVIETVFKLKEDNLHTAGNIARSLRITLGSLTVAVNTLETKGYLTRVRSLEDKRVIFIEPTQRAEIVNQAHTDYHHEMILELLEGMSKEEELVLANALTKVRDFFLRKSSANEDQ